MSMDQLQPFDFKGHQVRAILIDGEPYFVGRDVAEVLGYANPQKALRDHIDSEDARGERIVTPSGKQEAKIISESGLYSLILSSKLPSAKEFKHWVTSEVLPAIRQHGAYITPAKIEEVLLNPDTIISLAQQLKDEREGRLIAEQRVNELTPKATYYDQVLANKALVTITQIAKDYGMSGKTMNTVLHRLGVIYHQSNAWLLYAKYQKLGWTQSETIMVNKKDGTRKAVMHTKWTQKGRLGLYELLKKNDVLPLIEKNDVA